jgi:hypothetical protein
MQLLVAAIPCSAADLVCRHGCLQRMSSLDCRLQDHFSELLRHQRSQSRLSHARAHASSLARSRSRRFCCLPAARASHQQDGKRPACKRQLFVALTQLMAHVPRSHATPARQPCATLAAVPGQLASSGTAIPCHGLHCASGHFQKCRSHSGGSSAGMRSNNRRRSTAPALPACAAERALASGTLQRDERGLLAPGAAALRDALQLRNDSAAGPSALGPCSRPLPRARSSPLRSCNPCCAGRAVVLHNE